MISNRIGTAGENKKEFPSTGVRIQEEEHPSLTREPLEGRVGERIGKGRHSYLGR
jgi:hypothetical protein